MIPRWYREEKRLQRLRDRPEATRARAARIRAERAALAHLLRSQMDSMKRAHPGVFTPEFNRSQGWTEAP